jgi:hypothetical protein
LFLLRAGLLQCLRLLLLENELLLERLLLHLRLLAKKFDLLRAGVSGLLCERLLLLDLLLGDE